MKKYQIIMPIALPLALIASFFYMIQGRTEINKEYQSYILAAQEYTRNDVPTDAIAAYQAALKINPTLEVYLAIGEIYLEQEEYRLAEKWYEKQLVSNYPNDSATYEFGIQVQLARGNVREAYQIYDAYKKRGLQSDVIEQQIQQMWYAFELIGDFEEVSGFSDLAEVAAVQESGRWGYVNTTGSRVLYNIYEKAGNFGDLAPVIDQEGTAYYIDIQGNKKLTVSYFLEKDPDFGQITQFADIQSNMILAYNGQVWNYYDATTYEKKFGDYQDATVITNGVGAVSNGSYWALISADGQELTPFEYHQVVLDIKGVLCRGNAVIAEKDGKFWLLDRNGQLISQTGYDDARAFNDNSWAAVKKEERWIFVNEFGEEMDIGDFEDAKSFSSGVAAVKQNNRWGYVNESGVWIIEPQFYDAEAFFSSGVAFVKSKENTWQLLSLYRFHHE